MRERPGPARGLQGIAPLITPHPIQAPLPLDPVPRCLACGASERARFVTTRAMMHPGPEHFSFSRCSACGLVYLDPRIPADDLGRYYTAHYLPYRGPEAWGRWRGLVASALRSTDRARVARVRRVGGRGGRETRVLDVGCGRPTFLEALVESTGWSATGTDFSDAGWRDEPARWGRLDLRRGDLHELDLDGPFDLVTMWHYLEHDYAPVESLRRVRELAGSDARLVVEVPDHGSWSRRRYGPHWAGYHTPRHTGLWDAGTLPVVLERAGWRVESIEESGTLDPWTLVWMSRQERRGIDWSTSMESRFVGFVTGRLCVWPVLALLERLRGRGGAGLLTAVARPA